MALDGSGVHALGRAEDARAGVAALRPVLDDLVHLLKRKQRSVRALMPGLAAAPRPLAGFFGRGGAEGGSCEGGSEELRELRRNCSSTFSTRASRRSYRAPSARMKSTQRSRPAS